MDTTIRAALSGILVLSFACGAAPSPEPAVAASSAHGTAAAAVDIEVAIDSGRLVGTRSAGIESFRGVPFAAPPVGELRWREPQPMPPWQGARLAREFGSACIQKPGLSLANGGEPGALSEDCLYLNVSAPAGPAVPARPVMVWLHGGALVFGSGSVHVYDGRALAARGMVVVTVNYRLGSLGTFAHPALGPAGAGSAINFGLLDQIAALRWVRRNAAAFGGDPDRVTVFGQSAGAESVLALFASPLARGLFARGIAQSGYGIPSHTPAQAVANGIRVADALGLPGADATADALRAIPAEAFASLEGAGLSLAPSLVAGDKVMPSTILAAFRRGREAPVPLVIGNTSDDSSVVAAFGIDPAAIVAKMGAARVAVRPFYPPGTDDAELGRVVTRDVVFTAFARRVAYLHAARAPTWRYYFDHVPEARSGKPAGTPHGGEIAYSMGTGATCDCTGKPWSAADEAVSARIVDAWTSFATVGVPASPDMPAWPQDGRRAPVVMELGDVALVRPAFMASRLDAFIGALNVIDLFARKR